MKNNTQRESYSNLVKECMEEMTQENLELLAQFALHFANTKPKQKHD